jgi:hypothetical protein
MPCRKIFFMKEGISDNLNLYKMYFIFASTLKRTNFMPLILIERNTIQKSGVFLASHK